MSSSARAPAVPQVEAPQERRWRRTAQAAVLALFSAAFLLAVFDRLGWVEHLGVPAMDPAFADLRAITGAADSIAEGLDPLRENPGDPWGRPLNYPRVWLIGAKLGLTSAATPLLAALVWLAGAWGMAVLAREARSRIAAFVFALAVLSPVSWFALERANTDLVMFGLLAAAALFVARRPTLGAGIVGLAALLKLYPIFALTALFGGERPKALRLAAVVGAGFCFYAWSTRDDLALIAANTQHWPPISYGIEIAPRWLAQNLGQNVGFARGLFLAAAYLAAAAVLAASARLRGRVRIEDRESARSSAAFRVGASVYVGSFLLGSNFDYRLLFLLFTLPRLSAWASVEEPVLRRAARATLGILLLLLWSSLWRRGLAQFPAGDALGRALDEALTWCAWCALASGLVLSLPPLRASSGNEREARHEFERSSDTSLPRVVQRKPAPRRAEPTRTG